MQHSSKAILKSSLEVPWRKCSLLISSYNYWTEIKAVHWISSMLLINCTTLYYLSPGWKQYNTFLACISFRKSWCHFHFLQSWVKHSRLKENVCLLDRWLQRLENLAWKCHTSNEKATDYITTSFLPQFSYHGDKWHKMVLVLPFSCPVQLLQSS